MAGFPSVMSKVTSTVSPRNDLTVAHLHPEIPFLAVGVHHEFLGGVKLAFLERLSFLHENRAGESPRFDHLVAGEIEIAGDESPAFGKLDGDVHVFLVRPVPHAVVHDSGVHVSLVVVEKNEGVEVVLELFLVEIAAPEELTLLGFERPLELAFLERGIALEHDLLDEHLGAVVEFEFDKHIAGDLGGHGLGLDVGQVKPFLRIQLLENHRVLEQERVAAHRSLLHGHLFLEILLGEPLVARQFNHLHHGILAERERKRRRGVGLLCHIEVRGLEVPELVKVLERLLHILSVEVGVFPQADAVSHQRRLLNRKALDHERVEDLGPGEHCDGEHGEKSGMGVFHEVPRSRTVSARF